MDRVVWGKDQAFCYTCLIIVWISAADIRGSIARDTCKIRRPKHSPQRNFAFIL